MSAELRKATLLYLWGVDMNKFLREFFIVLGTLFYMSCVAISVSFIRVVLGDTFSALLLSILVLSLMIALFMRFIDKVDI